MKVKAIRKGYYNKVRVAEGTVFELADKKHFSKIWMEAYKPGKAKAPEAPKGNEKDKDNDNETVI